MSEVRLYLAVQRLNVGDSNWATLLTEMQAKGVNNSHDNPSRRNHWRPSLDETTYIFEALFESTNIDVDWFIDWLATTFSVDPGEIGENTGYNSYGRFSTFSYGGQNRIRVGVFGFVQGQGWPSWPDSHDALITYLIDNIADWEE